MTYIDVLTRDGEYARGLSSFLCRKPTEGLRAIPFSDADALSAHIRMNHPDCVVLEDCFTQEVEIPEGTRLVVLSTDVENSTAVYMYNGMDYICNVICDRLRLLETCEEHVSRQEAVGVGNAGVEIVCVTTPIGGAYASSFAYALSVYHSKGGKTLFISFDPFFMPPSMQQSADTGLAATLFMIDYGSGEELLAKSSVSVAPGLDCICGVGHWIDICEFTPEHMEAFLRLLRGSDYAHVVIDTGLFGKAQRTLLENTDRILSPVAGRAKSRAYTEWMRQLEIIGIDAGKVTALDIPYDSLLTEETPERRGSRDVALTGILKGQLGRYIEEMEGHHYVR